MKKLINNLLVLKRSIFYSDFKKIFIQVLWLWVIFALFEGMGISLLYPVAEYLQSGSINNENYLTKILDIIHNFFSLEVNIFTILSLSLLILSLRFFFQYKKNIVTYKSVFILENLARNTLIDSLYNSNLSFLIKKKEGEWLSSFSYDLVRARSVVTDVSQVLGYTLLIILYFLILCIVSLELIIYSLPIFLLTFFVFRKKSSYFENLGVMISKRSSDYLVIHEDVVKNIFFVKMRGLVSFFQKKLQRNSKNISSYQDQIMRENYKVDSYLSFLLLLGIFYIILVSKFKLNLGFYQTAIFLFILSRIAPCLQSLVRSLFSFLVNIQSLKNIIELSERAKEHRENINGNLKLKTSIIDIKFQNVSFDYSQNTKKVIKDLNFSLHKGESLGIVGRSGSGKTTILNLLTNFYKPISGMILINNKNINCLDTDSFRKRISYLPQNPELFNDTIRNNLLYGLKKKIDDKFLIDLLKKCYCEFISDLPEKLDSKVGDRGLLLSGGQRQRLVIARAILNNSDLIIMDEATTGLDDYSEKRSLQTLKSIKSSTIQIISSHRMNTIKNTDKILFIDKNKGYIFGKTKHLLNSKKIRDFFKKPL